MAEINFPTEVIELPSQGKLYPKDSPLASGKVTMRYMSAQDEDILTNQSFIEKGVVVDKLLQSLIVDNINYGDLLVGDKNALLVAARILGYGSKYSFEYRGEMQTVELAELQPKPLHPDFLAAEQNLFTFTCPATGTVLEFKLLTHADEKLIEQEIKGIKKMNKDSSPELSTRIKYMIQSVDGVTDRKAIRDFVDTKFLARDSRAFRQYVSEIQPDIDMRFYPDNGPDRGVDIPLTVQFLWPDFES